MTSLFLTVLLASAAPRVLVLSLEPVGVEPTLAQSIDPVVAAAASAHAVEVISQRDIEQMAKMEAEKAAMGCDTSSCLAELAGALGAELVLYGSVGKLGASTVVTLSLFDTTTTQVRREVLTTTDLGVLPFEIPPRVSVLLRSARPQLQGRTEVRDTAVAASAGPPLGAIALLAAGGALVVGGGGLALVNEVRASEPSRPGAEKADAQLWGRLGIIGGGTGLLVGAAGALLLVLGGSE